MERAAELVERFAKVASRSIALQVCVIFPCMVLLCKIFGLFAVWTAGIATTVYYLIRLHNEETQKFHKSYVWTLQSLIHKRHELPEHTTADEATRDAGGAGETLVLESMANMWWKTNGQSFFQKSVLDKIVDALNENIANNNSMVQEFIAGKVQLSTDSPKLLAVHCKTSSYNSIYQDMNWEYHSNTSLPFSVVIASRNIPIEICKIKFLGTIRVETIFPHQEYKKGVQCKEQESYTMAISIIDEYLLDFDIVASSINLGGIPSLRKWIRNTIYKKLRNKALWPNQIRLFGPADHLFRQQENPTIANSDSIQLDYAEPIPIELQPESKEPPKFITGISLFFPDGKSSSPPAGFDLIDKTCTGNYAANLASGSVDQRNVYICVKSSSEGAPLNSIAVVKESDLESMPEEFRLIRVTDFGEDAYISQVKGKQGSRVYFCYEKGPTEKGYITDIRVMFDSEIPKVRELKQRYDAQGVEEFPIGYTTLHVNTVRQANGDTKRIFLCIKRTGGTTLKNLAPESTSAPSLRTTGSNIINKLHTLTNIAVNEAKDIKRVHSEKRLKRLESIGITSAVIEKVKYLSKHPEIIQNYPLEGRMPKDDFFVMNESQQNHAIQIMKQVPQLGEIRRQLAPAYMSDSAFWYAYFSFMKKTIEDSV